MFKVRVIPCLDVKDGRVVKGVNFVNLRDAGDPVEAAIAYDAAGADELCFLDITASHENRDTIFDVVTRTAEACFMPLTVGGGVRTVEDIRKLLACGADKVGINTAAVVRRAAADHPGRIVVGIDARDGRVAVEGWAETSDTEATALARLFADAGVAAIVYTDIARDGALTGVDASATAAFARAAELPVIASGGIASLADITALVAYARNGIDGAICGRALYDGRVDPRAALRLVEAA